eukprot:4087673-Amphidinium_carterae.1
MCQKLVYFGSFGLERSESAPPVPIGINHICPWSLATSCPKPLTHRTTPASAAACTRSRALNCTISGVESETCRGDVVRSKAVLPGQHERESLPLIAEAWYGIGAPSSRSQEGVQCGCISSAWVVECQGPHRGWHHDNAQGCNRCHQTHCPVTVTMEFVSCSCYVKACAKQLNSKMEPSPSHNYWSFKFVQQFIL